MKRLLTPLIFLLAQAGIAPAATMTFDNYDFATASFSSRNYSEAGIKVTGNAPLLEAFGRGGGNSLYLADGGWGGPNLLTFTMASLFDAVSFDLTPSIFNYFITNTLTDTTARGSFMNVRVQGFTANGLAAVTSFDMGSLLVANTYSLGSAFMNLTSLVIGFEPTAGFDTPVKLGPNTVGRCTDVPCSRYFIDNVTLAPVPLPASLPLMLAALAAMAVTVTLRRRPQTI